MQKDLRMDSHKLMYHPATVSRWLQGENIYPIEIEISPSGACNHRCVFCAVDYLNYQPYFLKKDILLRDIRQMSEKGLKSVICSGEGEPLLNKDLPDIVNAIKSYGVDVAMSSNGVLFRRDIAKECLASFTWIRFSVASMERKSYQKLQRGADGDLERLKENLADAVAIKREKSLKTTLGVQCLLLPENMLQLPQMARELREIGVDYLTIKPYSQHLHSKNRIDVDYQSILDLKDEVCDYATETFSVYFRSATMKRIHEKKEYEECHALPFMTHIDSRGNVWPCVAHIGVNDFCYGNIYDRTFQEIWEGEQRTRVIQKLASLDINQICRDACRLDHMNQYLDDLKHPGEHVNFI